MSKLLDYCFRCEAPIVTKLSLPREQRLCDKCKSPGCPCPACDVLSDPEVQAAIEAVAAAAREKFAEPHAPGDVLVYRRSAGSGNVAASGTGGRSRSDRTDGPQVASANGTPKEVSG